MFACDDSPVLSFTCCITENMLRVRLIHRAIYRHRLKVLPDDIWAGVRQWFVWWLRSSSRNQQIARSSVGVALHLSRSPSAARLGNKGVVECQTVFGEAHFKDPLSCFAS